MREVNIMAELPGLAAVSACRAMAAAHAPVAATPNLQDLKAIFSRFIDERQQATGGHHDTAGEDQLFGSSNGGREVKSVSYAAVMRMVRWLVVRALPS